MEKMVELYNDNFQNWKKYLNCKAQLIIADPPYNLGKNAYASNPAWYKDGDNKNGESELAGKEFFDTDKDFRPAEFMHFCSQMLVKEPKNGVTDADIENGEKKQGWQKDKNRKPLAWCCSALSSSCTITLNWGSVTDSCIISLWCSVRISVRRY